MKKIAKGLVSGVVLLLASQTAFSATARLDAYVERTQLSDGRWGECMAGMDREIAVTGLDCPYKWVSFSCTGEFNVKTLGKQKYDMAQLAQAMNYPVSVYVDDSRKHNGICYGTRIVAPGFGTPAEQ